MWGFDNLKDVLDVLIIPITVFCLGVWVTRRLERQKRDMFVSLIGREYDEMAPDPDSPEMNRRWPDHLKKRFIHQDIFSKPSENRDFILSLPPDFAYHMTQLWMHFEEAKKSTEASELAEHGARWCDYLKITCKLLDKREEGSLYNKVCVPWQQLIHSYITTPSGTSTAPPSSD